MKYLVLLFACFSLTVYASDYTHKVFGTCIDNFTTNVLDTGTVILMNNENIPLDTAYISKSSKGRFSFVVNDLGTYNIKIDTKNYETVFSMFRVRSKREEFVYLKPIRMDKKALLLDEVTVKASMIKMVMNGDTIVYNSAAFNLAEGSMLQDLIKELPGAEINESGQIFINGRFIQSLLINGKDFFVGNPMVALQNLPAYTVSKIKVFDQASRNTHMMKRNMGDNQYTMDVKLKKKYGKGYSGNLEAGIGTDNRYRIKSFGMRTTEVSDLIGFVSMNNLNETATANSGGGWRNSSNTNGLKDIKSVGLSYQNIFDKTTRSSYGNNLIYSSTDENIQDKTNRQTFFEFGDLYSRSNLQNRTKNKDLTYTGNLMYGGMAFTLLGDVKARYARTKRNERFDTGTIQNSQLLNTMNQLRQSEEKNYFFDIRLQGGIKHISDMIDYYINVNYDKVQSAGFDVHDLTFLASDRDYQHRFLDLPNKHFHINGYFDYDYYLKNIDIIPFYNFTYENGNTKNILYRLDKIAGIDSTVVEMLPSAVDELRQVVDSVNTYHYQDRLSLHSFGFDLKWRPSFLGERGELKFQSSVSIQHQSINYFRLRDYRLVVNNIFFSPSFFVSKYWGKYSLDINGRLRNTAPSLDKKIDYYDNSDPLHVKIGNSSLKNIHELNTSSSLRYYGEKVMYSLDFTFSVRYNDIAYSTMVDPYGVTTTKPVNVDGNYNMDLKFNYTRPIDKAKKIVYDNKMVLGYRHSVDMNYIPGMSSSDRSIVLNYSANDNSQLKYRVNSKTDLSINLSGTIYRLTSARSNFDNITAGECVCGVYAGTELFWKLRFSTDLNQYNRYGYQVKEMNTHNFVWNAYLSRSFLAGKLAVNIEAIDLLHQLSNIQYVVDAQGRTETWNNSIPRYIMASLVWKLNSNKKK